MYGLIAYLLLIFSAMKKQPKTGPTHNESEQQNTEPNSAPILVTCTLPPESDEEKTEKKQERARNKRKFYFEVGGFFVLMVYTFFTGAMYFINRDAARAAQIAAEAAKKSADMMVLEERPWISLTPGEGVPDGGIVPPKTAIGVQYSISNPGKTAAVDVIWETFNTLVRPGGFVEPVYRPLDPLYTKKFYPANGTAPTTTFSGSIIHSNAELRLWQDRKMWEELAIRVSYKDTLGGTPHVTESCIFVIFSNAANPQCPKHNYQN